MDSNCHARFEIYMAVKIEIVVFWVVAPCSVVAGYDTDVLEDHAASIFRVK